jgi:hypothetical protein
LASSSATWRSSSVLADSDGTARTIWSRSPVVSGSTTTGWCSRWAKACSTGSSRAGSAIQLAISLT